MFIGDYKKIVFFTTPRGPLLVCLTQNQGQLPPVCVCVCFTFCVCRWERRKKISLYPVALGRWNHATLSFS